MKCISVVVVVVFIVNEDEDETVRMVRAQSDHLCEEGPGISY